MSRKADFTQIVPLCFTCHGYQHFVGAQTFARMVFASTGRTMEQHAAQTQAEWDIRLTPFARDEFDAAYEPTDDPIENARRLVVLSHMGFGTAAQRALVNGRTQRTGFRANTTRSGTTPAGDWCGMPDVLVDVGDRLRGVVIEQRPAILVMAAHDSADTLHYVDPPYTHGTRGNSSRWNYRHELTDDDHSALAVALRGLRGRVVLSGYACELYDLELFPDWHRVEKETHADGARDRTEVLWLNPACRDALNTLELSA
jgi:DNA adenine methylase